MDKFIQKILAQTAYNENPYFATLKRGDFERNDFIETQIQFYHAVIFFCRPMAALVARIPTPEMRIEILRNVWEECGEGDLSRSHGATFTEFLYRLDGITPRDIERRNLWPEVQIFNTTLVGACMAENYLIGTAMFGIIERMFCEISSWIGTEVVKNGWLARESMIHYNTHEVLDVKHAQDFFDILRPAWSDSSQRESIEQGLHAGAALFNNLYEGLYRHRKRRLFLSST